MIKDNLLNVTIVDNGAAFLVLADGLIVGCFDSLGGAWRHIEWMYCVASHRFTVGKKRVPVLSWLKGMYAAGML